MAKTAIMKVWNVELGLAVHIKAPNGKYVVIDLGSTQKRITHGVTNVQKSRIYDNHTSSP